MVSLPSGQQIEARYLPRLGGGGGIGTIPVTTAPPAILSGLRGREKKKKEISRGQAARRARPRGALPPISDFTVGAEFQRLSGRWHRPGRGLSPPVRSAPTRSTLTTTPNQYATTRYSGHVAGESRQAVIGTTRGERLPFIRSLLKRSMIAGTVASAESPMARRPRRDRHRRSAALVARGDTTSIHWLATPSR